MSFDYGGGGGGEAGPPGPAGNMVHQGAGPPSQSLGDNGDLYFNTTPPVTMWRKTAFVWNQVAEVGTDFTGIGAGVVVAGDGAGGVSAARILSTAGEVNIQERVQMTQDGVRFGTAFSMMPSDRTMVVQRSATDFGFTQIEPYTLAGGSAQSYPVLQLMGAQTTNTPTNNRSETDSFPTTFDFIAPVTGIYHTITYDVDRGSPSARVVIWRGFASANGPNIAETETIASPSGETPFALKNPIYLRAGDQISFSVLGMDTMGQTLAVPGSTTQFQSWMQFSVVPVTDFEVGSRGDNITNLSYNATTRNIEIDERDGLVRTANLPLASSSAAGLMSPDALMRVADIQTPGIAMQNSPPASPSIGDRYIVGGAPTGAWAGNALQIATWTTSAWQFSGTPVEGWVIYLTSLNKTMRYYGTGAGNGWDVDSHLEIYEGVDEVRIGGRIDEIHLTGTNVDASVDPSVPNRMDINIDASFTRVTQGSFPARVGQGSRIAAFLDLPAAFNVTATQVPEQWAVNAVNASDMGVYVREGMIPNVQEVQGNDSTGYERHVYPPSVSFTLYWDMSRQFLTTSATTDGDSNFMCGQWTSTPAYVLSRATAVETAITAGNTTINTLALAQAAQNGTIEVQTFASTTARTLTLPNHGGSADYQQVFNVGDRIAVVVQRGCRCNLTMNVETGGQLRNAAGINITQADLFAQAGIDKAYIWVAVAPNVWQLTEDVDDPAGVIQFNAFVSWYRMTNARILDLETP